MSMKKVYFLGHVYVSCEVCDCDINMFIKNDDIKNGNVKWINDNIECSSCRSLILDNYNSILDNINTSNTLKEYKEKEYKTQKTLVKQSEKKHICDFEIYIFDDKIICDDMYKNIMIHTM